jgi:hypothetical protein
MQKKAGPGVAVLGGESVDLIQLLLRRRHIDPNRFGRRRRRLDKDGDRIAIPAIRHNGCFTIRARISNIRARISNLSLPRCNLEH